ncbi:MAG TPA: C1 family peptidase [Candidatus Obscuribacterales bacterium]
MIVLPAHAGPPKQPMGLKLASPEDLRGVPIASTPFSGAELPKKVDLAGNMPPPGDQGNQNSCVGWATAYALKSYQEKVEERRNLAPNGRVDPKMVFSPAFIYNQINNGRDGGSTFADALNLLSNQGAVSLAEMPYDDSDYESAPPEHLQHQAKRYRIDYWRQVNIRDLKEVKAQISAGYPVLIGALIDEGFTHAKAGYIWKKQQGQSLGGHAMALVGYDDSRQAFKLINSWGTGWGDKGFGWVDYKFFPTVVREGYVAKDAVNGPAPQPTAVPSLRPSSEPSSMPSFEPTSEPSEEPEIHEKPIAEQAQFQISNVEYNLPAPAPAYEKYGPFMKLTGPVMIPGGAGQNMQVVIRFYFDDGKGGKGKPVPAQVPDIFSVPDEGIAATGTPLIDLPDEGINDEWYAFIPYNAFKLPPGRVNLVAEPMLYVDNFGIRNGNLIRFWVETAGSEQVQQPTQNPATANGPAEAARDFFQAMYEEEYPTAWALLTEASKQGISQLVAQEAGMSVSQIRKMFDSNDDTIMEEFWPNMRDSMNIDNWVSQRYVVQTKQGNQASVQAQPIGVKMMMKLEGGHWKLGYVESFMGD